MNQTVKANLKTFTLGLNEDCQHFGNAKLYTISSEAVRLRHTQQPLKQESSHGHPDEPREKLQLAPAEKSREKYKWFMMELCTNASTPVCNSIKMKFGSKNTRTSLTLRTVGHRTGFDSQLCHPELCGLG